ncbi:bifunctional diguanylate cyclase/phosphodiesterase, partial [Ferrimicrobium acidiphilum]|uniref:bifunctional diguanylate cyclase/phosphodiesterase n=1 Tax=Ferrimicrobium acidiphilum TaxID=121039 RepID=UPI0023F232E4
PVAEIIFACHPEEVLGKPVAVLLPGRSQQEVAALLADLAARPQVVPYVTDYLRSNGDMLQLSVTAVPLSYPDGTSGGLTVIVRDLTPSLRVATELESRDALYRTIVETAHEGIAIFDRDLVVRFANPRLDSMVGYDIEELVGSSVTSLLYPDDVDGVRELVERRYQGFQEMRMRRRDGTAIWTLTASSPIPDETGEVQSLVMFTDITDRRAAELALLEHEDRFRRLFEYASVGIVRSGLDSVMLEVNPAMSRMLGYPAEELVGRSFLDITHPDDRPLNEDTIRRVVTGEDRWAEVDKRYLHRDGHVVYVHVTVSGVPGPDGVPIYLAAIVQDITEKTVALEALHRNGETLRLLAESAQDLIFRYRLAPEPHFDYASPALETVYGWRLEDFPPGSDPMRRLIGDAQIETVMAALDSGRLNVAPISVEATHKNGRRIWSEARISTIIDDTGELVGLQGIVRDVSERKAVEDQLAHQALHDPLTGLPNRTLFSDRVQQALTRLKREISFAAVLFLDLDGFKLVNDSLGHALGDELLQGVGERLRSAARSTDSVARLGGDEFVVLCENLVDPTEAMTLAERLLEALAAPFDIAGHQLFISASIGVATTPATDPDTFLRDADTAMYQAKKSGRNRCTAFHPGLHEQTSRHLRRASELHGALERNELRVFYQPLLSLASGEVIAFEALLRWEHPIEGMLFPEEFITVAEDAGLMPAIGAWVLLEACSQTARWTQDYSGLSISVNVSPHQITEELIVHVQSALAASDLSPSQLVLEVTESAVVAIANVSVLERLREIGIRISVDDFGTGFSSLAQLQELPVDELKIDRAFVQRLAGTEADAAIVTSIIELAHTIGLNAVAEGVETTAQAAAVRSLGCDSGQGYLWSRPVGFKSVPALLQRLKNPEPSDPRHPSLGTPGATPL